MNKKILWIVLLAVILIALVVGLVISRKQEAKVPTQNNPFNKDTNTVQNEVVENKVENAVENTTTEEDNTVETEKTESNSKFIKTVESDGVLYSKEGKKVKADVVIGDKYFDTTINDIWTNPDSYKNKTIEIEGMYLENKYKNSKNEPVTLTFVGRYTTSNLCPNCPPGYSYFEYELKDDLGYEFKDSNDWIKVVGTPHLGKDSDTGEEYYYLEVLSLEVMNEKGNDTVNN